jgi:hydroxymethylbilane synthase
MTERALEEAFPGIAIERRIIKTTGDKRTDVPLIDVAKAEGHLDKGVFIKELETALAAGEIDFAVHSLKDVPSELEEGFAIAGVLPRAPVGDALITKNTGGLAALPVGATVATSSVRRQRQLQWMRPDLRFVDIRGNVPTRLRKLSEQDELDGILLAEAGLRRLGLLEGDDWCPEYPSQVEVLAPSRFFPAASQGAVGLEVRAEDARMAELVAGINHAETFDVVTAERAFLVLLGAGCETPVGVWSHLDGDQLQMRARVFEEGEAAPLESAASGPRTNPKALAQELADNLSRIKP